MAMCWGENEDYFECLHGFKEKKRKLQVVAEKKRREDLGTKFDINSDSSAESAENYYYSKTLVSAKNRESNTE